MDAKTERKPNEKLNAHRGSAAVGYAAEPHADSAALIGLILFLLGVFVICAAIAISTVAVFTWLFFR